MFLAHTILLSPRLIFSPHPSLMEVTGSLAEVYSDPPLPFLEPVAARAGAAKFKHISILRSEGDPRDQPANPRPAILHRSTHPSRKQFAKAHVSLM